MVIDSIAPGETVTRRVQVVFATPGSHVVQATLPDDPLNEDNSIACALDIADARSLLVIDGDASRRGWFFLNATLNPGGMTRTGWKPVAQGPSFLRDTAPETLASYSAIALTNVTRLDPRAIANLETYVRGGGGLAIILGGPNPHPTSNTITANGIGKAKACCRSLLTVWPNFLRQPKGIQPGYDRRRAPDLCPFARIE